MKPRKLPSGNWTVQIMVNGHRISVTESTKSACVNRALLIKSSPPEQKKKITWREAIEMYVKNSENVLSPSTCKFYRCTARNHFKDVMDLSLTDDINWQVEINKEAGHGSAKGVKNNWGVITATMAFHGITPPKVRLPQIVRNERPYLDEDQIKILLKHVKGMDIEMPILLALNGLRRSELLALKKSQVDFESHTIHVAGAVVASDDGFVEKNTSKNVTSNRIVPILIPRLEELLKESEDPLVRYAPESISRKINLECLRAGLDVEPGTHGLRHSMASYSYGRVPEATVMKWGGWSNPDTMRKIYTHISEKKQSEAAETIRSLF